MVKGDAVYWWLERVLSILWVEKALSIVWFLLLRPRYLLPPPRTPILANPQIMVFVPHIPRIKARVFFITRGRSANRSISLSCAPVIPVGPAEIPDHPASTASAGGLRLLTH